MLVTETETCAASVPRAAAAWTEDQDLDVHYSGDVDRWTGSSTRRDQGTVEKVGKEQSKICAPPQVSVWLFSLRLTVSGEPNLLTATRRNERRPALIHLFIQKIFRKKKKKEKKIQEILRYTFRDGVRKLRHGPAIGGKLFEASDTELEKKQNRTQWNEGFLCSYSFSSQPGNRQTETWWKGSNRDRRARPPQKVQECKTERQRRNLKPIIAVWCEPNILHEPEAAMKEVLKKWSGEHDKVEFSILMPSRSDYSTKL